MPYENLSDFERRLLEFIKENDFQTKKWSTREAARILHCTEDDVYNGLAKLSKEVKDNIWIYYEDGGIRIVAE